VVRPIPSRDAIPTEVPKRDPNQRAIRERPIRHANPSRRHANHRASRRAKQMRGSTTGWSRSA
jgi:hypothetical protein